ncbi:MAG: hypothetical protein IPK27_17175 [Rhodanobacteraceae bacterium]|nr:hypothetical protein [Rhodanobacteraceae bacterium]
MITLDFEKLKALNAKLYASAVQEVFGDMGATALKELLGKIVQIYARLDPSIRTHPLAVFADATLTPSIVAGPVRSVTSVDNLTNELDGPSLVRVTSSDVVQVVPLDVSVLQQLSTTAVVYLYNTAAEKFIVGGKVYDVENVVAGYPSAFCRPTFGTLRAALDDYRVRSAARSTCYELQKAWEDNKHLRFKNKPEAIMRRSLTQFLRNVLRNENVQPEQNVDETHPVDIHVAFQMTSQHAIIEIKWLGKSVKADGSPGTAYSKSRALEGAKQLADYLDSTHQSSPHYGARGYLVVFDGRRGGLADGTTELDATNALHYEHSDIDYAPDYSTTRQDFDPPMRMFLYPKLA